MQVEVAVKQVRPNHNWVAENFELWGEALDIHKSNGMQSKIQTLEEKINFLRNLNKSPSSHTVGGLKLLSIAVMVFVNPNSVLQSADDMEVPRPLGIRSFSTSNKGTIALANRLLNTNAFLFSSGRYRFPG